MNSLINLDQRIAALDKKQKIAFISSPKLGDTLIFLVTINNFQRNGFIVEVYGDFAYGLRNWFPWVKIEPAITASQSKILENYAMVFHMYPSELSKQLDSWHINSIVLSQSSLYKLPITVVDIQVEICRKLLGLTNLVRENNITPPSGLINRKYKNRIIFHPTSGQSMRNWQSYKFIKLAKILESEGFDPKFIVSPEERKEWSKLINEEKYLPNLNGLNEVSNFIYESGWFIGNDSGVGHLASNLQIPTLTLILRPSLARQWRPSFAPGLIVLPPVWLITRPLKEKFWQNFISVTKVYKAFKLLVSQNN